MELLNTCEMIKAKYREKRIAYKYICEYLVKLVKDFRDEIAKTLETSNREISYLDKNFEGLPCLFIDLSSDGIQKRPDEINLEDVSIDRQYESSVLYYIDYSIKMYLGLDPFDERGKFISIPYRTGLFCNKWVGEDDYKISHEEIMIQAKVVKRKGFEEEDVLFCKSRSEYYQKIFEAVDDFIRRVREEIKNS